MEEVPQRQETRENVTSLLNETIEGMWLAKEISTVTPAKAAFGSVGTLLTRIRVRFLLLSVDLFQAHVVRIPWPTKMTVLNSD